MTLYDFNRLSTSDQHQAVWEANCHLRTRIEGNHAFMLYAVGNFFVEICYDGEENELVSLTAFKATRLVEPYLEGLEVE